MKTRGMGSVYRQKGRRIWWVKFYYRGKAIRESCGSTVRKVAVALLKRRLAEMGSGRFHPDAERVMFEDLAKMLEADYLRNGRRSWDRAANSLTHLRQAFGLSRAVDITPDRVDGYIASRMESGAKPATVRLELAALGRMFTLAYRAGRIASRPPFSSITVDNARTGFFEEEDLRRVVAFLPAHLRPVALFAYLTGWRKSEVVGLRWKDVDFAAGTARLEVGTTKNREGRVFPFWALPELAALMREQRERHQAFEKATGRVIPWVFHHGGRTLCDFHTAWRSACRKAGVPGRLFHDLRRSAVRNLERGGVSRSVAMKLTGHKTETVYRRYAIVSERDLGEGVQKLAAMRMGSVRAASGAVAGSASAERIAQPLERSMVREARLELAWVSPLDPKSSASANSATLAR